MTMPQIKLDQADAIELAELLAFLTDWFAADPDTLDASLTHHVASTGYDLGQLRHDLHRFTFLLGGSDGQHLFTP
jgi:hypothetical protein